MDKVTLEARGYGHAAFVLAVVAFHLWFALDAWRASSSLENLMLVVPLTAVALALSAFILAGILRSAADPPDEDVPRPVDPRIPLLMLALCAYLGGLMSTGFDVSTFLFLCASLWLLGERRIWVILLYGGALTAFCVFGLREMISVPVPTILFPGG